jgi:hypothetical protein
MKNKQFNTNKDQSITFKVNTAMKNMLMEKAKKANADLSKYILQIITEKFSEEAKAERQKQEKIKDEERLKRERIIEDYAEFDKATNEQNLNFDHTPTVKSQKAPQTTLSEPITPNWKVLLFFGATISFIGLFSLLYIKVLSNIKRSVKEEQYDDTSENKD